LNDKYRSTIYKINRGEIGTCILQSDTDEANSERRKSAKNRLFALVVTIAVTIAVTLSSKLREADFVSDRTKPYETHMGAT
jgi:hypothetical protein